MSDNDPRSPEQIRADIERTRDELGDTVEALAAKTDVKARAQDKKEEVKANVRAQADAARTRVKDALPSSGESAPGDGPSVGEQAQQAGNQVVERIKANPLPYAIVGAVVLGYLLGRRRSA